MWTKRSGSASMKYEASGCRVLCQLPENMEEKNWLSPVRVARAVTNLRSPTRRVIGSLLGLVEGEAGGVSGSEVGGGEGGTGTPLENQSAATSRSQTRGANIPF